MTCEFCENKATHKAVASIGPVVNACKDCCDELGPAYTVVDLPL